MSLKQRLGTPTTDGMLSTAELKLSGKKVPFRPYTVKTEKELIAMAKNGATPEELEIKMNEVVQMCTNGMIDINQEPYLDVLFLFLQIAALSKGNATSITFQCKSLVDDEEGNYKECGQHVTIPFNLGDVELVIPEGHEKELHIFDNVKFIMKYPTGNEYKQVKGGNLLQKVDMENPETYDAIIEYFATHIDMIVKGDEVIVDFTKEELIEYLEDFSESQLAPIINFFMTMPHLRLKLMFVCPCGHTEELIYEDITSFFTLSSQTTA